MTRRGAHTNPRGWRRASAYVLVLGASALVGMLGLAGAIEARAGLRMAQMGKDTATADTIARGLIDYALAGLEEQKNWRGARVNGNWASMLAPGVVTSAQIRIDDETDGDLGDDPSDPFRITVQVTVGSSIRAYSAAFKPVTSDPNILVNPSFESGSDAWSAVMATLTPDDKEPGDGLWSMTVEDRTMGSGQIRQTLTALDKRSYTISGMAKSERISGLRATLRVTTNFGTFSDSAFFATGVEWTDFSVTVDPMWIGDATDQELIIDAPLAGADPFELDALFMAPAGSEVTTTHTLVPGSWRREPAQR